MPSKADLEQELEIVTAELDAAQKDVFEQRREIDSLRGQLADVRARAETAGVALAPLAKTPAEAERAELDHLRAGVSTDLQALDELRNPPPVSELGVESTLEIVRANQRERAELQQRIATANTVLSRVASALRIDRWDEDGGTQLVERVNRLAIFQTLLDRKIREHEKVEGLAHPMFVEGLRWALGQIANTKPTVDFGKPRILNFIVNGHDTPVDAQPEHSLGHLLGIALVRAQCQHRPIGEWLLYAEDGARVPTDKIAREYKSTRIIATLPIGAGA